MNQNLKYAQQLIDFIYKSPSPFHVAKNISDMLKNSGFTQLVENEKWCLKENTKYYVVRNDSALIAFDTGEKKNIADGFKIIAAHTDSPGFMIKHSPEIEISDTYIKLNTEGYGAAIMSTWMDRPLCAAGRVLYVSESSVMPVATLVNISRPILTIPNLAIHLNRDVNKGVELNKQIDMLPIFSIKENDSIYNSLRQLLAEDIGIKPENIISYELYLYDFEKGTVLGANKEFISCGKLDDLQAVFAGLNAIINSNTLGSRNVFVAFDNEEVGSTTMQGANSDFLASVIERIILAMGSSREDYFISLANSTLLSADAAHAQHPNKQEKSDLTDVVYINRGPVIKHSSDKKYSTDSISSAYYETICNSVQIPVQHYHNRSDMLSGSTIGPVSITQLSIRTVDIGIPILAMHSIRELGGVLDNYHLMKSFEQFYR